MRSYDERRQQKTPRGALNRKEAVKPRGVRVSRAEFVVGTNRDPSNEGEMSLLEKMLERENMLEALRRVESNKGAPGVDGMTVAELRSYVKTHWTEIRQQLLEGTYKPQPVRRVEIPKPGGGVRGLGHPDRDRPTHPAGAPPSAHARSSTRDFRRTVLDSDPGEAPMMRCAERRNTSRQGTDGRSTSTSPNSSTA